MSVASGTPGGSTELHWVGFPGVLASAIRPDVNSSSDTPEDAKRDQRGSVVQSERCRATTISGVVRRLMVKPSNARGAKELTNAESHGHRDRSSGNQTDHGGPHRAPPR